MLDKLWGAVGSVLSWVRGQRKRELDRQHQENEAEVQERLRKAGNEEAEAVLKGKR